ncbi:hypothetical protein COT40_01815 [Candidatus Peregrinibacteria bacterium CG08_land_8_20_14_0_20_41_10]|nr:MAG: hypothetical protein COT40_01815 [Candidatus Peregrinibacteria bacterium CG08_land_8_20_14_0_20_41_10]
MFFSFTLLSLLITALFGWGAFVIVLLRIDPFTTPLLAVPLLLITLFLACLGTFTLVLSWLGNKLSKISPYPFRTALRQAILLSLFLVVIVLFFCLHVFNFWNLLLTFLVFFLMELSCWPKKRAD